MRKLVAVAAVALVVLGGSASAGSPRPELAGLVTADDVRRHLIAFQDIAERHGGSRAAGTPGFEVSAVYVERRLLAAGYTPRVERFRFPYWREKASAFLGLEPERRYARGTDYATLGYSGSGDVTAEVEAVDVPAEGGGSSGCQMRDFTGFAVGAVALLQRGGCLFRAKAVRARRAGASAVVVFNGPGREGPVRGTVGRPLPIPVIGAAREVGVALAEAARRSPVRVRVRVKAVSGTRSGANVLAERQGGSGPVILAGAHLDSAPGSPGVNDNASGAAALLAVAQRLTAVGPLRRTVRFAWWGAEEVGLRGSRHHVAELGAQARRTIALSLNFDMLGSPNGVRGVYDGDRSLGVGTPAPEGSAAIERLFREHFASRHLPAAEQPFDGRSDYGPFIEAGIPVGGLTTGTDGSKSKAEAKAFGGTAGEPFDSCYHVPCDRVENVDRALLDSNADAMAAVLQRLATAR
ncbi:M20/M25/M40 family metallo-hydrolase [Spirillospora albida]|uniref:M20/M25/M40 family metallo-hydrolase n=1 Tax=Spirillospora albida TaxID=58123 RepID=UPI000ADE4371|nr:M20/M25/M40 family metallo-hydrolase [Spirillospora albida]